MDIWKWTRNLPIRSRLLYGYLMVFLLVVFIGNTIIYYYFLTTISRSTKIELSNSTLSIRATIEAAAKASLTTQLHVIAERNLEIVTSIYKEDLKEKEAKERAARILTSQSIGKSGFLYVVNSLGTIQVHSNAQLIGKILPDQDVIFDRAQRKFGYLEYKKSEQDESVPRINALYMTYFGPWDWIISATIDKSELSNFLDMNGLRRAILANQTGKTGTPFVMDSKGNLVIHSRREGQNVFNEFESDGKNLISEMMKNQNGRMLISWQSPGEPDAEDLLIYYDYLPMLDWIVASSCSKNELYQPLSVLRTITLVTLICLLILAFTLTWQISNTITQPIKHLMRGLKAVANGDFTRRLSPKSTDELGQLESYFNTFIAQLEESNTRLYASEKGFRSIFENSVEGIFQFDMSGHIIKVNPSFVSMLGYNSAQTLLDEGVNFHSDLIVKKEIWNNLIELIISERTVKGFELQLCKRSGAVFWCLLNARGIHGAQSGEITRIEGFLSDINARKAAQAGQQKILEDLETMVAQRTIELSNRISELEQRDTLNRYMGEMGDMLQSCRSIEETYPVIDQYLKKLFPCDSCALYLHDNTRQIIDRVVPATLEPVPYSSMNNDSCWALRRGKSYLFKEMTEDLTCDHVEVAPHGYVCSPLIAHGVTIGLLHILFESGDIQTSEQTPLHQDRKTRLCSRLAEHLSLALANLKLQEELKVKSTQDSLTGLANRRYMEEIMQRQFHRLLRYNTPCSLIMIDVDHFKKFNDKYGHDMGDYVLCELGRYLKDNSRGEDLACRFGGEEFIIIMVDTDTDQAHRKAKKMCAEISRAISISHRSKTIHITVSIGVASSPVHGKNMTDLLKSADNALYQAKNNGRNRVEVAQVENNTM